MVARTNDVRISNNEEDTEGKQLLRRTDPPLGDTRWTHALSGDENAPVQAVIRDCTAREGVWSCRVITCKLLYIKMLSMTLLIVRLLFFVVCLCHVVSSLILLSDVALR